VDHLAIPVRDQERSRNFYETYFGFGARPARRYDDDVLMLYNASARATAPCDGASVKSHEVGSERRAIAFPRLPCTIGSGRVFRSSGSTATRGSNGL